jgi:alpha-glucosidase
MKLSITRLRDLPARSALLSTLIWAAAAQTAPAPQIRVVQGTDVVEVQAVAPNIVRIHFQPGGKTTPRTLVMDPGFQPAATSVWLEKNGQAQTLTSSEMKVVVDESGAGSVQVQDGAGKALVTVKGATAERQRGGRGGGGGVTIEHDANENLYGIHGMDLADDSGGILRNAGGRVAAGVQGNGGAPLYFSKKYAVLVDSDGGMFRPRDESIRFSGGSRPDSEVFVVVGAPKSSMAGVALLTGKPPMPPKWTLGFLNSQWGSTETEWQQLTETYKEKGIPVSGYILDFDWKAWGEDDYGEWRWNSTSGAGSHSPNKFPNGASGKFAADLLSGGIHLAGILKPRILINRQDGKPTQASQYATDHNLWYPNEERGDDYFTRRPAGNLDFAKPETRTWYWEKLVPAFRAGMSGWWNDEADRDGKNVFNNFQFLNMARSLYEGQRGISDERAWSINRNYYLGSARYAYAEWSGDIDTGFQTMAYQRRRMIATMNLGESAWSMDGGGFNGHPTPENYARWIEFAAFVPVFRVHGGNNEKRQPWVYGPVAEGAAKRAMRMRYDLMPYIYSNARVTSETGIGIVRPLFWEFPDEERCDEQTNAWMFGDALLVSPIVELGRATHTFYLPRGNWFDYSTGKSVTGGADIALATDATTWQDIPMYVREGSILATQPAAEGNELSLKTSLLMDVFPSNSRLAGFLVYDDDGHTYSYEKGDYFRQEIAAKGAAGSTEIAIHAATGAYKPHFPDYVLRVHGAASVVINDGRTLKKFTSDPAFRSSSEPGWLSTTDKFGAVAEIRIPADGKAHNVRLSAR